MATQRRATASEDIAKIRRSRTEKVGSFQRVIVRPRPSMTRVEGSGKSEDNTPRPPVRLNLSV